jgi:carotenoid cleavage dioxygenase-like enzyme
MPDVSETPESAGFALGFTTLDNEVHIDDLPVEGAIPQWLTGTLVRNGPARFDGGRRNYRHWFDGQAMLHRFAVTGGRVAYANRYLDTPSLQAVTKEGRIRYPEFATDPCTSIFGRFFTRFNRRGTSNACVNVVPVGDRYLALTETPLPVEFDIETLTTAGVSSGTRTGSAATPPPRIPIRTPTPANSLTTHCSSAAAASTASTGRPARASPAGSSVRSRPNNPVTCTASASPKTT